MKSLETKLDSVLTVAVQENADKDVKKDLQTVNNDLESPNNDKNKMKEN